MLDKGAHSDAIEVDMLGEIQKGEHNMFRIILACLIAALALSVPSASHADEVDQVLAEILDAARGNARKYELYGAYPGINRREAIDSLGITEKQLGQFGGRNNPGDILVAPSRGTSEPMILIKFTSSGIPPFDDSAILAEQVQITRTFTTEALNAASMREQLVSKFGEPVHDNPLTWSMEGPTNIDVRSHCSEEIVKEGRDTYTASRVAQQVVNSGLAREAVRSVLINCPGSLTIYKNYMAAKLGPTVGVTMRGFQLQIGMRYQAARLAGQLAYERAQREKQMSKPEATL